MSVEKVEKVAEKVVEKGEQEQEKFEKALKKINVHKLSVLIPAIKHIITILQNLQKKPSEAKNRKLRTDNVAIKKFVSGVEGMQDFLEIVGYKATEVASKKFLEIEQESIDMTLLGRTIGILSNKLKEIESPDPGPPKPDKARISCVGPDCKFWGDEKTENMCSVCYKKKYLGKAAVAAVPETKTPILCTKDCGFYGLPKYQGMCSQCYSKDSVGRRKVLQRRWRIAMTKIRAVRAFRLALRPVQKNRNRCWKCRRRVGIAGIECRCGYIFCGEHRYAGEHDCPYDFKKAHQQKLLKENLKLTGKKFDKIDSDGE